MTYTKEKIAVKIGGRRYVRTMFFMYITSASGSREERIAAVMINGEEYIVFRKNGVPQSVYKLTDYLSILNDESPAAVTSWRR